MIQRTAVSRSFLFILIGVMVYLSVDTNTSAQRRRRGRPAGSPIGTPIGGGGVDHFIASRDLDSQTLSDLRLFRVKLASLRMDPKLRGQDDVLAASGFSLVQLCGEWNDVGRLKTGQGTSKASFFVVQQQLEREVIAELTRYSRLASELQIEAEDVPLPRIDEDDTEGNDMADLERLLNCIRGALEDNPESKETPSLRSIVDSDAGLAEELRAAVAEWPVHVGDDETLGEVTKDVPEQELRKTLSEKLVALDQKLIKIRLQASSLSSEVGDEDADNSDRPSTQAEQLFGPATEEPVPEDVEDEAQESDPPREPLSKEELVAEMLELRKSLLTASLLARSTRKAGEAEWPYAPVKEEPLEAQKTPVKPEPRRPMLPFALFALLAAVVVGVVIWNVSRRQNSST